MTFTDFTAGKDDDGRRIDRVIRIFAKNLSLSQVYSALRKNLIRVNEKKCTPSYKVHQNDKISIADVLLKKNDESPRQKNAVFEENVSVKNANAAILIDSKTQDFQDPGFKIIFENEHILIINKPYGISVHDGKENLAEKVTKYLENSDSLSFRPGPLHRLDKETTGLIAFSKSLKGAVWFTENIKNHLIKKKYIGIVQGKFLEEIWEDDIPQHAKTIARAIAYGTEPFFKNDVTLAEFSIFTGRKHQIRIQSQIHNHPLLGDVRYGGNALEKNPLQNDKNKIRKFYLHAYSLEFPQNDLGLPFSLTCPPDSDAIEFWKSLKTSRTL